MPGLGARSTLDCCTIGVRALDTKMHQVRPHPRSASSNRADDLRSRHVAFRRSSRADVSGVNTKQKPRQHDLGVDADEALAAAREMLPGPERIQALKRAGQLRKAADTYGLIFAKRGRPSK